MTSTLLADTVQRRMLGNTKRFFGSAEDKEGEDEEDEEERWQRLKQNGMIDMGDKEHQKRAGRKTDGSKPAAVVIGWQRGERQPRAVNSAQRGIPHLPSQPTLYHQTTNQPLYHPVLTNQQARRRLMERSMTTVEDSQFAVIVFRIGIPDIKQTVCAFLFTHIHMHSQCVLAIGRLTFWRIVYSITFLILQVQIWYRYLLLSITIIWHHNYRYKLIYIYIYIYYCYKLI